MSGSGEWISIPVREKWPNEASDFTPWLAKNIHLLSEAVEIKLEVLQEEAPLPGWGGRVDILAEVAGSEGYVVIENQMEESDNDHLAGLLNYASQSGSKTLIWVAGGFSEWHIRTVDWLNETDSVQIYAVQMSAWRSGDAKKGSLELVAGPNRQMPWRGFTFSTVKRTYLDFFGPVVAELSRKGIFDVGVARARNYQTFPCGFPGIGYDVGFWHSFGGSPSLDVYLWIATPDIDRNKEIFDALYQYRDEIEGELTGVSWARKDNQRMSSIYFMKRGAITDPDEYLTELQGWAADLLLNMKATLQPRLEKVMQEIASAEGSANLSG